MTAPAAGDDVIAGEWVLYGGPNYNGTVNAGVDGVPWRIMDRETAVSAWRDLDVSGYHQGFPCWGDGMADDDDGVIEVIDPKSFGVGETVTVAELTGREWTVIVNIPGYIPEGDPMVGSWEGCADHLVRELDDVADSLRELADDDPDTVDALAYRGAAVQYAAAILAVGELTEGEEWGDTLPSTAVAGGHDLGIHFELARVDRG